MMLFILLQSVRIGHPLLGYIVPAAVFGLSFYVAILLFFHFTRQEKEAKKQNQG